MPEILKSNTFTRARVCKVSSLCSMANIKSAKHVFNCQFPLVKDMLTVFLTRVAYSEVGPTGGCCEDGEQRRYEHRSHVCRRRWLMTPTGSLLHPRARTALRTDPRDSSASRRPRDAHARVTPDHGNFLSPPPKKNNIHRFYTP